MNVVLQPCRENLAFHLTKQLIFQEFIIIYFVLYLYSHHKPTNIPTNQMTSSMNQPNVTLPISNETGLSSPIRSGYLKRKTYFGHQN